jgi:N-acyl homoserine lactone hydrolase
VRVIPLETGRLNADLSELVGIPGHAVLPVPAWIIDHPRGLVLFDAGLHRDLQLSKDRLRGVFRTSDIEFSPGEELSARITSSGFLPDDVAFIIFSHLHFDHCGGTAEVHNARLILQRSEWDDAHKPLLIEAGIYNPDDFDIGHEHQLVDGVHDVFGDGRIVCVPTPGHTRGHQSLRLELHSGPIVLAGDCVYFSSLLDQMHVPVFSYNRDLQLKSMHYLAKLRDEGTRLIFGHDIEQFRSIPTTGIT